MASLLVAREFENLNSTEYKFSKLFLEWRINSLVFFTTRDHNHYQIEVRLYFVLLLGVSFASFQSVHRQRMHSIIGL